MSGELRCPEVKSGWNLCVNGTVSRLAVERIRQPGQVVMLFEAEAAVADASGGAESVKVRHDGRASIGFCDGHASLREPGGLRWNP